MCAVMLFTIQEARTGKDALDEEALRLRTELLRQQRSYWQATVALKERCVRVCVCVYAGAVLTR